MPAVIRLRCKCYPYYCVWISSKNSRTRREEGKKGGRKRENKYKGIEWKTQKATGLLVLTRLFAEEEEEEGEEKVMVQEK